MLDLILTVFAVLFCAALVVVVWVNGMGLLVMLWERLDRPPKVRRWWHDW